MSNNQIPDNAFSRFMSGKGFYVALFLCLAAAGAAAWLAVGQSLDVTEPPVDSSIQSQPVEPDFGLLEDANQSQPGVAVESSQSALPSSSSEEPKASQTEEVAAPVVEPAIEYMLPITGEIIAAYSDGELVKNETLGDWRTHNGIDIAAETGAAVVAAGTGTVSSVKNDSLWGYVVEIEHADGHVTTCCGLGKDVSVAQGDRVVIGQKIGTVGSIPCESLLPGHIHFEVKKNSELVDPAASLGIELPQ